MANCSTSVTDETFADFIVRNNNQTPEILYEQTGAACLDFVNTEYVISHRPLTEVLPLAIEEHTYTAIPNLYTLLDTTSMEASGIPSTFAQPALNTRGEGTIIGFIDTGIDYENPLFFNPDGTTRIIGIWDQSIPGESFSLIEDAPYGAFIYGTHYTPTDINAALTSEDPLALVPSTDTNGHGTFMAGIAAGCASPSGDFIGAAPSCSIAVVKLKPAKQYLRDFYLIREDAIAYQENDIMMAIKYLLQLSTSVRMPLTIYLGIGTNQGSHDGTSPLSHTLSALSPNLGIVAVCAAGNEVGRHHHYLGQIDVDTDYDEVEIRVAPGEKGFSLELWAREPELYTVGFVAPSGEVIQRIPIVFGSETKINFLLEDTIITVNYRNSEIGSGSQLIFMRFQTPTPGIWKIRVYNSLFINGQFHMWLPISGFISEETIFLRSNPNTTITDPGNTVMPITVSTYNHTNNSIYIHSSRGFNRNERIKPDIAAPGVNVYGPGLPTSTGSTTVTHMTGSSIAAAHVAGAAANLLSWGMVKGNDLTMSNASVKSYLIRGAKRNPGHTYPNREFGYGTLDLYQTFLNLRD